MVRGDVVGGHDDRASAAARADQILGDADGLCSGGAGAVVGDIRSPGADELGELGVPHRQDLEEEAPVEPVRLRLHRLLDLRDARVHLRPRLLVGQTLPEVRQLFQAGASGTVLVEGFHGPGEAVVAREGRPEDDGRVVAHLLGKQPARGELGPRAGRLVAAHEGNPRVAQSVDAGGDRQTGHPVQRFHAVLREPVLGDQVQRTRAAGELDDVLGVLDGLESRCPVRALHQPRDAPVEYGCAQIVGHGRDVLVPPQDARDVLLVEDLLPAGEPERGPCDPDAHGCRFAASGAHVGLEALVEEVGEHAA